MIRDRKKKHKIRVILSIFLFVAFVCCACSSQTKEEKVLKVGVRSKISKFSYLDPVAGTYSGFEVDLARALSEQLGYNDVQFTTVKPDTREKMLESGQVDCIIAVYSVTDERKEKFDFSDPYYEDSLCVMVENSTLITSVANLKDQCVGVVEGSTAAQKLVEYMSDKNILQDVDLSNFNVERFQDGVHFLQYADYKSLSDALESGEVDAVCADGCILHAYLSDDRTILSDHWSQQSYAVATQKDSALSKPIAEKIEQWNEDGTIRKMQQKWNLVDDEEEKEQSETTTMQYK